MQWFLTKICSNYNMSFNKSINRTDKTILNNLNLFNPTWPVAERLQQPADRYCNPRVLGFPLEPTSVLASPVKESSLFQPIERSLENLLPSLRLYVIICTNASCMWRDMPQQPMSVSFILIYSFPGLLIYIFDIYIV